MAVSDLSKQVRSSSLEDDVMHSVELKGYIIHSQSLENNRTGLLSSTANNFIDSIMPLSGKGYIANKG